MTLIISSLLALLRTITAVVVRVFFFNSGVTKERLKNATNKLEDVNKANIARSNDSYDDELCKRYGTSSKEE